MLELQNNTSNNSPLQEPMICPERRKALLTRLNRIEGQINGLKRMVEEDRACADILMQITSTQQALRGVTKIMMRNYLEKCVTDAFRSDNPDSMYNELMDVIFKYSR